MGTNYYWRMKCCPTCKRPEREAHIGKSSMGWTFSFQALTSDASPTGRPIASAAAWWEALAGDGEIRNEYGDLVSLAELKLLVENKRGGLATMSGSDFLDGDGHRFIESDFS